jgi:hypothetical protein
MKFSDKLKVSASKSATSPSCKNVMRQLKRRHIANNKPTEEWNKNF